MKYLKALMTAIVATAALLALACTASATMITVTTGNGTTDTVTLGTAGLEGSLEAGGESVISIPPGEIKCGESSFRGSVTHAGSATETTRIELSLLAFGACNATVAVGKSGTLEFHTEEANSNGNGTVTSNGTELTVVYLGLHCIFTTTNTLVGVITGTHTGHVTWHTNGASIPRTAGRSGAFCGTSASWNATYAVTEMLWNGSSYGNFTID